jgi:hypothetical protein
MRARAKIRVLGRFDGSHAATIIITGDVVIVRPFRRHKTYVMPLEAVARQVIYVNVKAAAEEKRRARRTRR